VSNGRETGITDCVVYVVDDDVSMREALDSLLRTAGWQVHAFAGAAEFLAAPRVALPACIVLDVSMPDGTGLDLQRSLNELGDRTPVIFMTAHGDIEMSVQAMKAGAADFLAKPFRDQQLLDAVALALQHDATQLAERAQLGEWRRRIATLSPREREVMRRVVHGMLNRTIATELQIAEITVKVHRRHVMDKMGAQSLAELVRMVDRAEPSLVS